MIIGLTGGIGSGKSTISRFFEVLGYPVFNSDTIAKEVYFDTIVKQKVISLLGSEAYLDNKSLNKELINSKIFNNTPLLHQLNEIIHPAVKERFSGFLKANKGKIVVKETALLFEAKLEQDVDKIILVVADDEIRIKRVMQRDGLSREFVLKKMKSQLPQADKIKKSDFIITNNEEQFIIEQVNTIIKELGHNG